MTHILKTTALVCSVSLFAACSTGGGELTFDEIVDAEGTLSNQYAGALARTDVPIVGTATYDGYIVGDLDDGRDLAGELELAADFGTGDVTGSASNFSDSNDLEFAGTLSFTGSVAFGGNTTTADSLDGFLEGDLIANGTTYDTAILLDGSEFYGGTGVNVPDAVAGDATGFLDDGGLGLLFDGGFVAEQP